MKKLGAVMLLALLTALGTGCGSTTTIKTVTIPIEKGTSICDSFKSQMQMTTDKKELDLLKIGAKVQGCHV